MKRCLQNHQTNCNQTYFQTPKDAEHWSSGDGSINVFFDIGLFQLNVSQNML